MLWLLLWLLHQLGENTARSPYSLSSLLLALHLAYHGFSEQCAQWDTARQVASQTGSVIQPSSHLTPQTTPLGCQRALALGFLCQTASSHWLSISHTVMYLFQGYSLIISPFLSHTVSKSLFSMSASPLPCR